MDERVLDVLRERLLVRISDNRGWLYARAVIHGRDVTMLDKIAQLIEDPRVQVKRAGTTFCVGIRAQEAVVKFCNVVLPYLHEGETLHLELTLAKAIAEVPWYERYEILRRFLDNGNANDREEL